MQSVMTRTATPRAPSGSMTDVFACARAQIYYNIKRKPLAQVKRETGCSHIINGYLFNGSFQPVGWTVIDGAVVEHAAIGGILLEDRIHSRERSREGPQVGIGIRTRLVFGGKVPRLVTGIERIVFAQQAAVGDTIISIDRIERCLGTVEVAGLARRRPVTGGKSTCGNCRSGEEECFLHYLLSVIRWVSGWYTAPASYGGPC